MVIFGGMILKIILFFKGFLSKYKFEPVVGGSVDLSRWLKKANVFAPCCGTSETLLVGRCLDEDRNM